MVEKEFISLAAKLLFKGAMALEFRTHKDKSRKETPDHFRRYINPKQSIEQFVMSGLSDLWCWHWFPNTKATTPMCAD